MNKNANCNTIIFKRTCFLIEKTNDDFYLTYLDDHFGASTRLRKGDIEKITKAFGQDNGK